MVSDSLRGLFKTTDGGITWEEKFDGPAGGGMIHFFDDTSGIAIHDQFVTFTSDSGENWDNLMPMSTLPFLPMESVFYTAANNAFSIHQDTIWFGTTQGRVFRSSNRGIEWEAFDTPFESNDIIASTAFRNAQEGMIISYARSEDNGIVFMDSTKVALTFNGGTTWELADTLFDFKINCMVAVPGNEFRFLGASNGISTISTDSSKTWQHFSFRPYNSIDFFNGELGWVGNSQTSADYPALLYKWEGIVSSTNTPTIYQKIKPQIFPNPFADFFNLKIEKLDFEKNSALTLEVFDVLGKKILSQNVNQPLSKITFPQAANGIYFYIIKNQTEQLASGRIVFKK